MSRATISLPTPLSPVMRTFASDRDACSISSSTPRIAALMPIKGTDEVFMAVPAPGSTLPSTAGHAVRVPKKRILKNSVGHGGRNGEEILRVLITEVNQ